MGRGLRVGWTEGIPLLACLLASCTHSFTHSCTHSFTHSFTHSLSHSFISVFIYSFIPLLTHLLTHSFTYPFIQDLGVLVLSQTLCYRCRGCRSSLYNPLSRRQRKSPSGKSLTGEREAPRENGVKKGLSQVDSVLVAGGGLIQAVPWSGPTWGQVWEVPRCRL